MLGSEHRIGSLSRWTSSLLAGSVVVGLVACQSILGLEDTKRTEPSDASQGSGGKDGGVDSGTGGTSGASGQAASCHEGEPCPTDSSERGLCKNGVCVECNEDEKDDQQCAAVYGDGFMCIAGACTKASCRDDEDCDGKLCSPEHQCVSCKSLSDCQKSSVYSDRICDLDQGKCIENKCDADADCGADPSLICCNKKCWAGVCCEASDCKNGQQCFDHHCTSCDAVSNNTYYVDPRNGDDTLASGSGAAGGKPQSSCAFKSITAVLSRLSNAPPDTRVVVRSSQPVILRAPDEKFPLVIPRNVTLMTENRVVLMPSDSANAVEMPNSPSALQGFSIDGKLGSASGVVVTAPPAPGNSSPRLSNLTIQNMGEYGIRVLDGGRVELDSGIWLQLNHSGGIRVDKGKVTIVATDSTHPVRIESNHGPGIVVRARGALEVSGVDNSVLIWKNQGNGIDIDQGRYPASVKLDHLSILDNSGSGIYVKFGSRLRLRNSTVLRNTNNGVHILYFDKFASCDRDDIEGLDLGTRSSPGHNVLQGADASSGNKQVGLCFELDRVVGTSCVIQARGNVFGSKNCNSSSPGKLRAVDNCSSFGDINYVKPLMGGKIYPANVSNCSTK